MCVLPPAATSIAFFVGGLAFASEENVDGDRLSECYGIHDAMVWLADSGKLSADKHSSFEERRKQAESIEMARVQSEGLPEALAREQPAGHALYMRSEMRKLAQACDSLVRE